MPKIRERRSLPVLLLLLTAACAGRTPASMPVPADPECVLAGPTAPRAQALRDSDAERMVIAVEGDVILSRAPRPRTSAERLVFAQLYETLLRLDCNGRVGPGLAESWTEAPHSGMWTFTLREGARFHDGSKVTPRDVAESWSRAPDNRTAELIASVSAIDERSFRVELTWESADNPAIFTHPDLAIRKTTPAHAWPLGTGVYTLADSVSATGAADVPAPRHRPVGRSLVLVPSSLTQPGRVAALKAPTLEIVFAGDDLRNALDAGADVLVTRDAPVIDYARARSSYSTTPLPWDRTYVLLAPRADQDSSVLMSGARREEFARDAVSGAARAASSSPQPVVCSPPASHGGSGAPKHRLVYESEDPVARSLAERIVALARSPGQDDGWVEPLLPRGRAEPPVAAGLRPEAFAAALDARSETAYVIAVQKHGWGCMHPALIQGRRFLLIDTRATAVLRFGLEGVVVDGLGTLFFDEARRRAGEGAP